MSLLLKSRSGCYLSLISDASTIGNIQKQEDNQPFQTLPFDLMLNQQHAKHECKLWLNGVGLPELRLSSF
jgi:hypothetical protein